MYAFHRAYGSMLVFDVQGALIEASYLARAKVYLGEQMSLNAKIGSRGKGDTDAILGDLERIPDARVLALFEGDAVTIAWTPLAPPAAPSEPEPAASWLPATTTLAAVKEALHGRLGADDYYRAMRLLLAKADRAIAVQNARAGANPPPGMNLDGFTFTLADLTLDPATPDVRSSPIALSPVSKARVDLTEARIRGADAAGDWLADPLKARQAAVALADLDRTERRAMAIRLRDKPLANALGGMSLGMDALELDDATSIQTAIDQLLDRMFAARDAAHLRTADLLVENQEALRSYSWPKNLAQLHTVADAIVAHEAHGGLRAAGRALGLAPATMHGHLARVGLKARKVGDSERPSLFKS